ncbi:MAG: ATPase, partial [Candidatus Peregrinibacteria bacterium]|nr:ATPase [Candidatus Peregrinibacteria bacterium]
IRATVPTEIFTSLFGPSLLGLGATLLFATILEVCSEGSMPVAADFLLRAGAPGNMFAFLMTGISTDYTEIMALKETTGHWKISLFLPLVTLPQVVLISLVLNNIH